MESALDIFARMLEEQSTEVDVFAEARDSWRVQRNVTPDEDRILCPGRPDQFTPDGDWNVWLILSGRGWGKTRTGAEDLADYMTRNPGHRCAIIAPTYADARDVCVEGESGLLAVLARYGLTEQTGLKWNKSLGQVTLPNGASAKLFSAETPARLRGPQFHRAWVDELAQVVRNSPEAWDMLSFGLRLGEHPQIVCTTTPLPVTVVRGLLKHPKTYITRGSTFDNADNLAPSALASMKERYEGTRLGRQELYAEMLDDIPGALWQRAWLDAGRKQRLPELVLTVVAVDPAVTSGENADETGIIVAGKAVDGQFYVVKDLSVRTTPMDWAARVVGAYEDHKANAVVIETNQGGDALAALLRQLSPNLPIIRIHAKKGKRVRAEPVSALYEQGRVHHVGSFDVLEDQICTWTPEELESPDRMDALVYAILHLAAPSFSSDFLDSLMATKTGA